MLYYKLNKQGDIKGVFFFLYYQTFQEGILRGITVILLITNLFKQFDNNLFTSPCVSQWLLFIKKTQIP